MGNRARMGAKVLRRDQARTSAAQSAGGRALRSRAPPTPIKTGRGLGARRRKTRGRRPSAPAFLRSALLRHYNPRLESTGLGGGSRSFAGTRAHKRSAERGWKGLDAPESPYTIGGERGPGAQRSEHPQPRTPARRRGQGCRGRSPRPGAERASCNPANRRPRADPDSPGGHASS